MKEKKCVIESKGKEKERRKDKGILFQLQKNNDILRKIQQYLHNN